MAAPSRQLGRVVDEIARTGFVVEAQKKAAVGAAGHEPEAAALATAHHFDEAQAGHAAQGACAQHQPTPSPQTC